MCAYNSAADICFSSLSGFAAPNREQRGEGARSGQHRSSLCREKLGMKLKLPSKAKAGIVTWSGTIYTHRRWQGGWWCLHHADDNRTERWGERERRSFHGATDLLSFILPGLKCKVSSSLRPHKSPLFWMERGRGRCLSQPTSTDDRVFIDQKGGKGREDGKGRMCFQQKLRCDMKYSFSAVC